MKLREIFEEYKSQIFKFIEPGGNYGDHLIWAGAKKLADQVGIRYKTTLRWKPVVKKDEVIYLHGGGGFISCYHTTPKIFYMVRQKYPRNLIIVGPTTTSLELEYLKKLLPKDDKNIIFFAREITTYNFIKNNFYSQTYHDHDTAFHLSRKDKSFKKFTSNISIVNKHSLLILREGPERNPPPEEIKNRKYDITCDPVFLSASYMFRRFYNLLGISKRKYISLHLKASKITTNRLHSAILGVIADKDVEIFSNSYHKNRSVWEYSLKDKGVKWIE